MIKNTGLFLIALPLAGLTLPLIPQSTSETPHIIVVAGHRDPREAVVGTKAMHYLPFDVPSGITRIVIHKELKHGPDENLRNTVDMGLFDPRGGDAEKAAPTATGFRGWQGGVPGDMVVTGDPDSCSPHAIPGALPAGRWYIAQYFLKSTPTGLDYKYTISLYSDGEQPGKGAYRVATYNPGVIRPRAGWYFGNMHSHTVHSDGGNTLDKLVTLSEQKGFDFIAITDHNSPATHFHFAEVGKAHPNHLLLFGDEFTSPGGHANIVNQKPGHFFDFRMDYGDGKLPGVIDEAHRQRALFTINHPYAPCTSCTWLYPEKEWEKADAIEVWNGMWSPDDRQAVDLWDRQLKAGRHIHAFGGTDYHRGDDAMIPAVRVYAKNLSRDAIMAGLSGGHVTLSESPTGPTLTLTDSAGKLLSGDTLRIKDATAITVQAKVTGAKGAKLRFIWGEGEQTVTVHSDDDTLSQTITPTRGKDKNGYVRAELTDESGKMIALTNPIYFKQ